MSRIAAIAYSCEVDRDPVRNTANHQGMVDTLNALIADDGWPGVDVVSLFTSKAGTIIEIAPGAATLSLELLRGIKAGGGRRPAREEPVFDGDQGRLV